MIKNGKDFWAGLMFMALGLSFMLVAMNNYAMGTAVRMGPAYFPTWLGAMTAILGAIIFLRAFVSKIAHPLRVFPFRPLMLTGAIVFGAIGFFGQQMMMSWGVGGEFLWRLISGISIACVFGTVGPKAQFGILVAVLAFGYILKPLGLIGATFVLIVGSAYAGHEFHWKEVLYLAAGLAIFSAVSFVWGLQLPINYWPQLG